MMRRTTQRGGFTLVELMITMVILTVGMLGLLAMQIGSLQNGAKGRHRTGAAMIARDQIERIQVMAFSDADIDVMDPVAWATPPWLDNLADPDLDVLIPTPPFPSYTSGHSTISSAAATVLAHLFPDDAADLTAKAAEAKSSRLWAGIHFPIDNDMGATGGAMVGRLVAARAQEDGADDGT